MQVAFLIVSNIACFKVFWIVFIDTCAVFEEGAEYMDFYWSVCGLIFLPVVFLVFVFNVFIDTCFTLMILYWSICLTLSTGSGFLSLCLWLSLSLSLLYLCGANFDTLVKQLRPDQFGWHWAVAVIFVFVFVFFVIIESCVANFDCYDPINLADIELWL